MSRGSARIVRLVSLLTFLTCLVIGALNQPGYADNCDRLCRMRASWTGCKDGGFYVIMNDEKTCFYCTWLDGYRCVISADDKKTGSTCTPNSNNIELRGAMTGNGLCDCNPALTYEHFVEADKVQGVNNMGVFITQMTCP